MAALIDFNRVDLDSLQDALLSRVQVHKGEKNRKALMSDLQQFGKMRERENTCFNPRNLVVMGVLTA